MRPMRLITALSILAIATTQACALTLTFDDVPVGPDGLLNYRPLGVSFSSVFQAADHSKSIWGPPHSGSNVLVWVYPGYGSVDTIGLVKDHQPCPAYSVGGYFSTEPGTVLQITGYHSTRYEPPLAWATIGSSSGAWNNVYVEISSPQLIGEIELKPVTTDAFNHFCMDDMTINYVPEPSCLSLLTLALASVGVGRLRRRR
jgi:hypothetical protein